MTEPQLDHNSRVAARRRKRLRAGKRLKRDLGLILLCMIGIAALLTFGLLSDYGMFTRDTEKEPGQTREPDGHSRGLASEPEARVLSPVEKKRAVKLAELAERPNELGKVPIIMYHVIGDNESEWVRTPENFRKDLQRFYELGYSLVPLQSYLSGNIDLPKGASPLVVTFDDATLGQFRLVGGECVSPDPDCAVGILLEFSKSYPDFGHAATFFVDFPCPFEVPDEADEKLNLLLEWGMEIGNHTYNHKNLWNVSGDLIQAELGKLSKEIEQITGSKPLSLALPYGGYPKDHRAREHLLAGVYEGWAYENRGVLLVGAEPALSPYHKSLNPAAIPRIRGSEEELSKWLGYLDSSGTRYVSDGKPDTITVLDCDKEGIAEGLGDTYEVVVLRSE